MTVKSELKAAYDKKVVKLTESTVRAVAADLSRDLVFLTPVDTGAAKANWLPSIGAPVLTATNSTAQPIYESAYVGYKLGQTVFISNNLPYIERLNNGWSNQMLTIGWVDGLVAKYKNRIRQAARAIGAQNGL